MPKIPEGAKVPQDHKKKTSITDDCFTFEHGGEKFTSQPLREVLTPKYLRHNRRREETDFFFTLIEDLFEGDEEATSAIDDMSWREMNAVQAELMRSMKAAGASLGE